MKSLVRTMADRLGPLSDDDFAQLVRVGPLIAVDLIVRNAQGQVLLGRRNFEPAKDWCFVPGGRILKDERIGDAFKRIAHRELGLNLAVENACFQGVHECFYPTSRFGLSSTHYVVLAYEITLATISDIVSDDQHSALEWVPEDELLRRADVHTYVKAYFQ